MSGRPPSFPNLPPKRETAAKHAKMFEKNKQRYLSTISQLVTEGKDSTEAKEEYRTFLIEKGKYFYSREEVLDPVKVTLDSIAKNDDGSPRFDAIDLFKRAKEPDYVPEGGKYGVAEFQQAKKLMKTNDSVAKVSSQGHSSTAKKRIWKLDIFGRSREEVIGTEVAHLLPDVSTHAIEWYDVACWAMGVYPKETTWEEVFRMLHGTNGSDGKRVPGSGMRHFVSNKVRVANRETVLDKADPQLLLLPIRTPEECRKWNGESYYVTVLVGCTKAGTKSGIKAAQTAIGLGDTLNHSSAVMDATEDDLKIAVDSLTNCIAAMVQSLENYDPPKDPKTDVTEEGQKAIDDAKEKVKARREAFKSAVSKIKNEKGETVIVIPQLLNPGPQDEYRAVCKVFLSNDLPNVCHPSVDPILLLARAAVIWSVWYDFRLRASAIAQNIYSEEELEEDQRQLDHMSKMLRKRQLEQYAEGLELALEMKREWQAPTSDEELSSISSQEASRESLGFMDHKTVLYEVAAPFCHD